MAKKFIINSEYLMMGHVEAHRDLYKSRDLSEIKGGGWWHVDAEAKKIWLYSSSQEFGFAKKEDIEAVLKLGRLPIRLKEYQFYYSTYGKLESAIGDSILLER